MDDFQKKLKFGLIGFPLGHSISPEIHSKLFELDGLSASYELFEIHPEELSSKKDFLLTLNGFNVTIPHKRTVMSLLSNTSKRAEKCGAVNTVKNINGSLCGYNTDAEGFIRALAGAGIKLSGSVLLCGSGGVARMMACEALEHGCNLTVADRKLDHALSLKEDFLKIFPNAKIETVELKNVSGGYDLILNGTPSGMFPNVDSCPVCDDVIKASKACFDAVSNPVETKLVKKAKSFGLNACGGIRMLLLQAVAAHEIWVDAHYKENDIEPLYNDMVKLTVSRYSPKE